MHRLVQRAGHVLGPVAAPVGPEVPQPPVDAIEILVEVEHLGDVGVAARRGRPIRPTRRSGVGCPCAMKLARLQIFRSAPSISPDIEPVVSSANTSSTRGRRDESAGGTGTGASWGGSTRTMGPVGSGGGCDGVCRAPGGQRQAGRDQPRRRRARG